MMIGRRRGGGGGFEDVFCTDLKHDLFYNNDDYDDDDDGHDDNYDDNYRNQEY